MKELRLGIAGLGTVAQGVLDIVSANREIIRSRSGVELRPVRVASRSPKSDIDLLGAEFSTDLESLLAPDIDVLVELIGGESTAKDLITQALDQGIPVVTANKAVIARFGNELLSGEQRTPLKFEAAVAGAIPIIQAIQHALVANRFEQVIGIINGTCNYILTAMQAQGKAFDDALAEAQRLGYAEADPSFDIDGVDAAHKLTILAGLAFDTKFDFEALYVEGISGVTSADIAYADELGYRIKHVGIAKATDLGVEARVHPVLMPKTTLLANVDDVANAVVVKCDGAGQTLFSGPGAGGLATASAVLGDVVRLATVTSNSEGDRPAKTGDYVPISDVICANYIRIPVRDEPGVFAQIANAMSECGISIEAAIQKEPDMAGKVVDIVIVTHAVVESVMKKALAVVEGLEAGEGTISRIRVEPLH